MLGCGASGEAAARLLLREGVAVTVTDAARGDEVERRATAMRAIGAEVLTGATEVPAGRFDAAVLSPGIASASPWVRSLRSRGVPVVAELELGWSRLRSRVLAITGTNGKSTMTALCRDALCAAGFSAEAAGNFGWPVCALATADAHPDWTVLEVSSFQLEAVERFRPDVGVLLNVQPNHLDRHGDMATYMDMKARIFTRMTADDTAVHGDDLPPDMLRRLSGPWRRRTFGRRASSDAALEDGRVRIGDQSLDLTGTAFDNEVLGLTAAAAAAALQSCGVGMDALRRAMIAFQRLPHRMQPAGERRGVRFVNDSKATNLAALAAGVRMAGGPVRLIAGGLLKEWDLEAVKKLLVNRVVGVYIIGADAAKLEEAWGDVLSCSVCGNLETAVRAAWKEARSGDVILLSPGCASFDQFKNFEERGDLFVRVVESLEEPL